MIEFIETFDKFISSLTLKDYLIYNVDTDYYNKYIGINTHVNNIKKHQISVVVKEFILDDNDVVVPNSTMRKAFYRAFMYLKFGHLKKKKRLRFQTASFRV